MKSINTIIFIATLVALVVGPEARGQNPYKLEYFCSVYLGKYFTSQILTERIEESGGTFENPDSIILFKDKDSIAIQKKRKELFSLESEKFRNKKSKKILGHWDSVEIDYNVNYSMYTPCLLTTVTLAKLGFTENTEKSIVLKKILNSKVTIDSVTYIITLCPPEAAAEYMLNIACQLGIGNAYFIIEPIKSLNGKPIDFLELQTGLHYGARCRGYCPCNKESEIFRLLRYQSNEDRSKPKYFSPNERLVFQLKRA